MSMLAERRQKKRYNLLPRGKALYEDDNSFGTRMLLKMGWSKGKGLGAKEDGNRDFVRVKYKQDNIGLGYEDRDDKWTQHETSFEDLLKSLSNSAENSDVEKQNPFPATIGLGFKNENNEKEDVTTIKLSGESLEEKSKKSKVRVHYKKFTRGKDLSQYSEKDLANIFGRKSLNCKVNINDSDKRENCDKETIKEDEVAHSFGITTISTGTSMNDYFKTKMALLKKIKKRSNDDINSNENIDENTDSFPLNSSNWREAAENSEEVTKKSKKPKKEGEDNDISKKSNSQSPLDEIYESSTLVTDDVPKKKKEKKKKNIDSKDIQNSDLKSNSKMEENPYPYENNKIICNVTDIELNGTQNTIKNKTTKNAVIDLHNILEVTIEDHLKSSKSRKRRKNNNVESGIMNDDILTEIIEKDQQTEKELTYNLDVIEHKVVESGKKKSKRKRREIEEDDVKFETRAFNFQDECSTLQQNEKQDKTVEMEICGNHNVKEKSKNKSDDQSIVQENKLEEGEMQTQTCEKPKKKKRNKLEKECRDITQENNFEGEEIQNHSVIIEKVVEKNAAESSNSLYNADVKNCEETIFPQKEKQCDSVEMQICEKPQKNIRNKEDRNSKKIKQDEIKEQQNMEEVAADIQSNEGSTAQNEDQCENSEIQESKQTKKNKTSKKESSNLDVVQENKFNGNDVPGQPDNLIEDRQKTDESDNCAYQISGYCAEKFRHTDISGFPGSNLSEITGYGMSENISLQVVYNPTDEKNIMNMWFFAIDKYKNLKKETKPGNKKKFRLKNFKKRKVFKYV